MPSESSAPTSSSSAARLSKWDCSRTPKALKREQKGCPANSNSQSHPQNNFPKPKAKAELERLDNRFVWSLEDTFARFNPVQTREVLLSFSSTHVWDPRISIIKKDIILHLRHIRRGPHTRSKKKYDLIFLVRNFCRGYVLNRWSVSRRAKRWDHLGLCFWRRRRTVEQDKNQIMLIAIYFIEWSRWWARRQNDYMRSWFNLQGRTKEKQKMGWHFDSQKFRFIELGRETSRTTKLNFQKNMHVGVESGYMVWKFLWFFFAKKFSCPTKKHVWCQRGRMNKKCKKIELPIFGR